jgi:hypothetical protein
VRLGVRAVAALLAVTLLAACNDDNAAEGDPEAFCAAADDHLEYEAVFEDLDPNDVTSATATFEVALQTERDLRADAPEAVRADIDILVRFFEDLLDGLEAEDPTSPDRPSVYDELRSRFDQVEAASDRIDNYVAANC